MANLSFDVTHNILKNWCTVKTQIQAREISTKFNRAILGNDGKVLKFEKTDPSTRDYADNVTSQILIENGSKPFFFHEEWDKLKDTKRKNSSIFEDKKNAEVEQIFMLDERVRQELYSDKKSTSLTLKDMKIARQYASQNDFQTFKENLTPNLLNLRLQRKLERSKEFIEELRKSGKLKVTTEEELLPVLMKIPGFLFRAKSNFKEIAGGFELKFKLKAFNDFGVTYTKEQKYVGEFKFGKREGKGKCINANGNMYEGEWKDGKKDGKGKFIWADGDSYEGEWKDGKQDGNGTFFSKGRKYEGEWKDDIPNGRGVLTVGDSTYDVEYKDGISISRKKRS